MSTTIMKKLIIISALVLPGVSLASTTYKFLPNSKIEAQIAADELNRIEIKDGNIMEVIGDEGKYSLYWSSDWRNLFIKPKISPGETFELSLIFFGGLAQDLRFTVGDTTAKTITVDMNSELRPLISSCTLQTEIASMMRAMFEGVKSKYYVKDNKRLLKETLELEVTQIKTYRYKALNGAVVQLKNLSKKPVNLKEEDFKDLFKDTLAINLRSTVIAPKTGTTVFVVTGGGTDDK